MTTEMMPSPELQESLRTLSLRMVDGTADRVSADGGDELTPLDVDSTGRAAATLIAHVRPRGVTVLHFTGLLRDRHGWRTEPMGSLLLSAGERPAGESCNVHGGSERLISSGVMPWSGFYLCCWYLETGPDLRQLRVAGRMRPIPDHGQVIVCWRARQRITEWGPGLAVQSGPGPAPEVVAVTSAGKRLPVAIGARSERQGRR
ncbi:hypothetical protein [Nakamurella lactea]|uniref:hypothetical protein n=1 Tax=Nakamurella lactea TaxID=459515 RepID=UPI0012B5D436|nr:hypothetical protein [Nakamurella lactea]